MNYRDSLDKALNLIRQLEIDRALTILYQLLDEHPNDLALVKQIYSFEVKRPESPGFKKIVRHILGLTAKSKPVNNLIIQTIKDYQHRVGALGELTSDQYFNLVYQLAGSELKELCQDLINALKSELVNHPETPRALKYFCEKLIEQRSMRQARKEIKYLIAFYAETPPGQWALNHLALVEASIVR